jgi:hypothetical protein
MTKNMSWMLSGCVLVSLFSFDAQALPLPWHLNPRPTISPWFGAFAGGAFTASMATASAWHPICSACGGGAARQWRRTMCRLWWCARRGGAALCAACGSSAICVPARLLS